MTGGMRPKKANAAGRLQPGEGAGLGWNDHRPEPDGESVFDASGGACEGAWDTGGGPAWPSFDDRLLEVALAPGFEHGIDAFVDGHAGVVEQHRILRRLQGRDGAIRVALVPRP